MTVFASAQWPPLGPGERPVQIPDLRKRSPLLRRLLVWTIVAILVLVVIAGAVQLAQWKQQREVEALIRQQYAEQTRLTVTSIDLTRVGRGKYAGTMTTSAGETLELTAEHNGSMIRWQVQVSLERKRQLVREDFEKINQPVRQVDLSLGAEGRFSGRVILENGNELDVREIELPNGSLQTDYRYTTGTVEKWVREAAEHDFGDRPASVRVQHKRDDNYEGRAEGESGVSYDVHVEPDPANKDMLRTRLVPTSDHVERWLSHQLARDGKTKVERVTLRRRQEGDYAGKVITKDGLTYDARAGMPPNWQDTPRQGHFSWQVALTPESYTDWARTSLAVQQGMEVKSLKLREQQDGTHVGVARTADGRQFEVRVWKRKDVRVADRNVPSWPDLGEVTWKVIPLD